MLDNSVGRALAFKTIPEEPWFMLPKAPLHGAGSLLESCTLVTAASRYHGELGIGWMSLLLGML
jgi:hypothetical protein